MMSSIAVCPLSKRLVRSCASLLVLGFALALVVVCAIAPAASYGARAHAFSFAFGGGGSLSLGTSPVGDFAAPGSGLAVNDTTHDLYVADTGNHRIVEFTSSGAFVRAWGWGVLDGKAEFEICQASCLPGLSGVEPGEFETPVYVAVDNGATSASKGDVYIGDTGDNLVTKLDAEGHLVSSWGNNGENAKKEHTEPNGQLNGSPTELFNAGESGLPLAGLSVDASGNLWVLDQTNRLFDFAQDGTWLTTCAIHIGGAGAGGIATNSSCLEACTIYVHHGDRRLIAITPACGGSEFVTAGPEESKGIAVDSAQGDIYVDREGSKLEDIPSGCHPSPAGCQPTQVFGEEEGLTPPPPIGAATGLAVDPGSGVVYVANGATEQIAAFGVVLEATTAPATGVGAAEATLRGAVNPEGSGVSRCVFEYGTTTHYGTTVECDQRTSEIGQGSTPVPVSGKANGLTGGTEIKGLVSGTVYHYRLHVSDADGNVYSEDETLQTSVTAVVKETSVIGLTAASATLRGEINTAGLASSFHFEYGPCDLVAGCAASPYPKTLPSPDGTVPPGSSSIVLQPIEELSAGITYHFRVVVKDANGSVVGLETTFIDEPPRSTCATPRPPEDEHLADCREYEMVTPPGKDGALIDNGVFLTPPSIAPDGSRVLAKSIQCFHEPESCAGIRQTEGEPYAFQRTAAGWQTTPLAPPAETGGTMLTYSAETGDVLYGLASVPPALEQLYARTPDGVFHAIGPISEATGVTVAALASSPIAATSDLSTVLFENVHLWPSLEGGATNKTLFEYRGTGASTPTLVAVTGPAGSNSLIGACGTLIGGRAEAKQGVLSGDARTVFFTVKPCASGTGANAGTAVPAFDVYARIEQAGGPSTIHVSASGSESECHTACQQQPSADSAFQGASPDGSRAYFTSTRQLTDNASEDKHSGDSAVQSGCPGTSAASSGCNLYEFECPNHCENPSERHLVDVSAGDTSGLGPQVQGVVAISRDGSVVYFAAHGVLASANHAGEHPVPGGDNLYAYRSVGGGAPGHIEFVTTLAESDATLWTNDQGLGIANVTPDGRYLLFTSHRGLTADATQAEGPAQVYRYDAQEETLLRVSIGHDGFNDNGNDATADAAIVPAQRGLVIGQGPGSDNLSMSDDGQFVFFETPTGLTPGALDNQHVLGNPKVLAENIYEWAADGAHTAAGGVSCEKATGCVSLISDGKDVIEGSGAHHNFSSVQLLGTDASGENVFFWTADPLVRRDTDSQVDLYDARVGGGFPEPTEPEDCPSLEACHGRSSSTPPVFSASASASFLGAGNPTSPPTVPPAPSARRKSVTRAAKLAKALKACHKQPKGRRRKACERQARRKYGPATRAAKGGKGKQK